ncbi:SPC25 [Auxenochlorella protothecoides x Auxenochlorella symbiontica]
MAPRSRKADVNPFVEETAEAAAKDKLDLGDAASIKRALDEAAAEALQGEGCALDHSVVDTRIAVGAAACLVALVAQFWPAKSPHAWYVLVVCVSSYAVLSATLSLLAALVEKESIARTKPGGGRPALVLSTHLPRWSDRYTLILAPAGGQGSHQKRLASVTATHGLGELVHGDGVVAVERVHRAIKDLLARLAGAQAKEQ